MNLAETLNKHSVVAIAGSRGSGKTSLALHHLLALKREYPSLSVMVMGVEDSLLPYLQKQGISSIESTMDILDLRLRDTVIYIAEFATLFNTRNRNKQIDKLMRFFDRLEHQNCKLLVDTAREGFFNKFFCGRVSAFLVKQIEYESLVNGTWLNERVKAIKSHSDYRLECPKNTYYLVCNDGVTTSKHTFGYQQAIDTKKGNKALFPAFVNASESAL